MKQSKYFGLENKKIGSWTILKLVPPRKEYRGQVEYECMCDCGLVKINRASYLLNRLNKDGDLSCNNCWRYKRAKKHKDLIGQKFGNWLVLDIINKEVGTTKYKCECQCDKKTIRVLTPTILIRGESTKCKFCLGAQNKRNCWTGYGDISGKQWSKYVHSAKHRKLEFNINIEYVWNIFCQQKGKCAISGLPIKFKTHARDDAKNLTASLDRIDSSKGYIIGNVQWIYKDIQKMKWNFNEKYFFDICKIVTEHQSTP